MKRILSIATIFIALFAFNAAAQAKAGKATQAKTAKKVLVVYYSWGGNTRAMAQMIHQNAGGDIVEIAPVKAYPSDYQKCVDQAKKEINAKYRPSIKTKVSNITSYDIIFVGSPNWWSTIAPPVATFLASHNLAGKTVVPFVTHGGGGMANCFYDIKKLCPKSTVLNGKDIYGTDVKNSSATIRSWVKNIK